MNELVEYGAAGRPVLYGPAVQHRDELLLHVRVCQLTGLVDPAAEVGKDAPGSRYVTPMISIVYAISMGVDAVAALASGWLYDRIGLRVLAAIPIPSAIIPALAFTTTPALAAAGVIAWGAVLGAQETTMRAAVADLVPTARRGTAYGVFATGFGVATLLGGAATGAYRPAFSRR